MTDSRRIDEHIQSQKPVRSRSFQRPSPIVLTESLYRQLCIRRSYHEISGPRLKRVILSCLGSSKRTFLHTHTVFSGYILIRIWLKVCRMNTQLSFLPLSRTRGFAGCLILAPFSWNCISRTELWLQPSHRWKRHSLSYFLSKVGHTGFVAYRKH